jgi:hypothetical protein
MINKPSIAFTPVAPQEPSMAQLTGTRPGPGWQIEHGEASNLWGLSKNINKQI